MRKKFSRIVSEEMGECKENLEQSHNRPIQTRANERNGVFQSALDEWE